MNFNRAKCSKCGNHADCKWIEANETFKAENGTTHFSSEPVCQKCLQGKTCAECEGSGFSGLGALIGNGYDAVCSHCGGVGRVPEPRNA
jgi:hypothetical protein